MVKSEAQVRVEPERVHGDASALALLGARGGSTKVTVRLTVPTLRTEYATGARMSEAAARTMRSFFVLVFICDALTPQRVFEGRRVSGGLQGEGCVKVKHIYQRWPQERTKR